MFFKRFQEAHKFVQTPLSIAIVGKTRPSPLCTNLVFDKFLLSMSCNVWLPSWIAHMIIFSHRFLPRVAVWWAIEMGRPRPAFDFGLDDRFVIHFRFRKTSWPLPIKFLTILSKKSPVWCCSPTTIDACTTKCWRSSGLPSPPYLWCCPYSVPPNTRPGLCVWIS